MRKFEVGDRVYIRKGVFEGALGSILQVLPSTEYPSQYKFKVVIDGTSGSIITNEAAFMSLNVMYYHSWEIMLAESEEKIMRYSVGERIEVISGPYCGFSGVITDICEEKKLYKFRALDNNWWAKESEIRPLNVTKSFSSVSESIKKCQARKRIDINSTYGFTRTMKPAIENVIFNDPATIVFWTDGTKTVVKAVDGETYDREKGLAMAISKKYFGNEGNYYNEFKKWLPEEDNKELTVGDILRAAIDELNHESDEAAK